MSLVHVYPTKDKEAHIINGYCWCEPGILNLGRDADGLPARVFVHQKIEVKGE